MKYLEQRKINVEFDTTELNSQQIRLIKSICSMLNHTLTTDDENEYFDGSAELIKMVARAVKQANFASQWCENSEIPYAEQALEFCIDMIADQMHDESLTKYDN